MDASALARIERQRTELENNIAKFRKALRHWQALEIDYEGLREEFLGIPEDSTPEECLQAAKESKPELVDEKEIRELLLDAGSRPRRPAQLVDVLSKRVDYVIRNIETIRKQLSDAEKKRNALLLAEEPNHRDEAGLPLAEITEELDEEGNIISSKVQTPGSDASQLVDVLKKAGVEDLEELNGTITKAAPPSKDEVNASSQPQDTADTNRQHTDLSTRQLPTNSDDTPDEAELRREMLQYSRGLDEVGAIVAELELEEEEASDAVSDDGDLDLDFDSEVDMEEESQDDSEDERGRSNRGLFLSRSYQKRMEELQKQLGLKNVGPELQTEAAIDQLGNEQRPIAAEAARKAAIAREDQAKKSSLKPANNNPAEADMSKRKLGRKKVAFSSELDVAAENAPATIPGTAKMPAETTEKLRLQPVNESIVEREADQDGVEPPAPAPPAPNATKQSRFKAARQSQPQTPMFASSMGFPRGEPEDRSIPQPPSKIVSAALVERPSPKTTTAPDPSDFSDQDHQREIARDYQQHRIKRILAQEGGFLGNAEEGGITPLEDEETGRRVSRFKAAQIKR
jgi:unconventional prefoldin RPB5 interactor 1